MRYGMVIDLNKCVGCYGCVIKCKQEHFLPPNMSWGKILMSETGTYPNVTKHIYPVLCNHCAEPACVRAYPTCATQQREDGIVWIDQSKESDACGDMLFTGFGVSGPIVLSQSADRRRAANRPACGAFHRSEASARSSHAGCTSAP